MKKSRNFVFVIVFSILLLLTFLYGVNAEEPNITLESGQIPTYDGINQIWFANAVNVPVQLSFTAPWDLTNGPINKRFTQKLIETKDAYNGEKFSEATVAYERTKGERKEYRFYKKTDEGLYWLGSSTPPSNPNINNFSIAPAIRTILLPAEPGKKIVQNSVFVSGEGNVPFTMNVKIIGKGTVIVGAGTFNDAVMVQQKLRKTGAKPFIVYQWYAPFVGLVAEVRSRDGETKELFTTAAQFEWMKTCAMP